MSSPRPLSERRWLILASAVLSFFAVGISFFAVPPLVPELVERFDLDHFRIGLLMGAIAIPAVLLSIPLGVAVDRWPARAAGNVGLILMVVGAALFAAAQSFGVLLVGRLLFGLGGLVVNLLLARLITTAFADRELALAMGVFSSVYPASMITIFSTHPRLFGALGWRGELLLLAAVVALAVPLHNIAVPRRLVGRRPAAEASLSGTIGRSLFALAATWMLFFVSFASVITFAPEWAGGGSAALLSVTLVMWVALVCSPIVGALIDRSGRPTAWLTGGVGLLAVVLVLMATGVAAAVPAMLAVGLTAAVVPTSVYALPGRLASATRVGLAFGFITAFSNLGTIVGPAMAGAIRDLSADWSSVWWALAAAAALAVGAASLIRTPATR